MRALWQVGWLLLACGARDPDYATEQRALVTLYRATAGDAWILNTGWLNTNVSHCTWLGVGCDQAGKVATLELLGNNLTGTLPTEIFSLTLLTGLYVPMNGLSGTLPAGLASLTALNELILSANWLSGTLPAGLAGLTRLTQLYLSTNKLIGTVSPELSSLTELTRLGASENALSGTVPTELARLVQLGHFDVETNSLSGAIPAEIGRLTQLIYLGMLDSVLSGTVPAELGSLTGLTYLTLGGNMLNGTVPVQLGSLTQLADLMLYNNSLSGTVPAELGSLTGLTYLSLGGNMLNGTVPVQLGSLTQLADLLLNNNTLSGTVPSELASLTALAGINLNFNSLSGTLPIGFASLSKLYALALVHNKLSGTLPVELASLSQLEDLVLGKNMLSGTVPAELANLSQLYMFGLSQNSLSGTVPIELAHLSVLDFLDLYTNRLSGAVPAELASLSELRFFDLSTNRLSGTVPAELASLTLLEVLHLYTNSLSGTLPLELTSLAHLKGLDLYKNHLSGNIPAGLSNLTGLVGVRLQGNRISGFVPKSLPTSVMELVLHTNSLSGTLPRELSSLTKLTQIFLHTNFLSGTLPKELASLSVLTTLPFNQNRLSGSLPLELSALTLLSYVNLARNSLSGSLPSFTQFNELSVLVLFDNNLWGRLTLPQMAPNLTNIAVQRNRLSCPVNYNHSSRYNLTKYSTCTGEYNYSCGQYLRGALLSPGNRLSRAARPSWAAMHDVIFQWAPETFWDEWRDDFLFAGGGLSGMVLLVCVVLRSKASAVVCFTPSNLYEQYGWLCTRILFSLGLSGLICLVPVYVSGAYEFECGSRWLRTTLAYLSGSPMAEWATAVLVPLLLGAQALAVGILGSWVKDAHGRTDAEMTVSLEQPSKEGRWQGLAVLFWPLIVLLFSIPSFLSILALSLPGGENTIGLSQAALDGIQFAISPMLSLIDTFLVPHAARWAAGVHGSRRVVGLISVARFVILVMVPFVTAIAFGADCYGLWVNLWDPCRITGSFNLGFTIPGRTIVLHGKTPTYQQRSSKYLGITATVNIPDLETTATSHSDICGSQHLVPGRCPRYVIDSLAKLLLGKLVFTTFVSPVVTLLLSLPWVARSRDAIYRKVFRRRYTRTLDLDVEFVLLSMIVDEALVIGLAVPVFPAIGCLAVASRLAVVHLVTSQLGVQFIHTHNPLPRYPRVHFALPLLFGAGFLLWFFISNAWHLHGVIAVYMGTPIALVCGALGSIVWWCWYGESSSSHSALISGVKDDASTRYYAMLEDDDLRTATTMELNVHSGGINSKIKNDDHA